jgi:DNA-binding SARP family transcriptional activator
MKRGEIAGARLFQIYLFGEPHFEVGGCKYQFRAPHGSLALLAYLLLHRGLHLQRSQVAASLWPDEPEKQTRARLRRQLYRLQRALPDWSEPWIVADENTITWNGEGASWLDVAAFEADLPDASKREAAIAAYSGDLLRAWTDEWLVPLRERLRAAYEGALEESLAGALAQNDLSSAARCAQRLLSHDPWREDVVRTLMTIREKSGDRAGALAAFVEFERRLRAEMNVEPMPETCDLRDMIRGAVAVAARAAAPPARGGVLPQALPFVGREAEMTQLGAYWSRATRGAGHFVLIGGEAGIGKTRLALQLSRLAESDGAEVLWGTTSSPESISYQSIAEAFRSSVTGLAGLPMQPVSMALLAQLLPELRARLPQLPVLPSIEAEGEQVRFFEAMASALEALARSRPLLIIFEDLHWASAGTITALEFLARRIATQPILIVGTHRPSEEHAKRSTRELRRRLQAEKTLSHIAVAPLAHRDVDELLGKYTVLHEQRGQLATHLHVICDGNPLFLGQALRDVLDGGAPTAAPQTMHALVALRLVRLSAHARTLAEIAATIGATFNVELLCAVSGWNEDAVLDRLDELAARNLVRERSDQTQVEYAFAHHVIHGAIYASSTPETRRRRHRRVAGAIEELYPTRSTEVAGELARHYDRGGETEAAAACYLRAARAALAVYADDDALDAIERGLELAAELPLRLDLFFERAAINAKRGDLPGEAADLAQLDSLANQRPGDHELQCVLLDRRILFERRQSRNQEEALLIEALLEVAQRMGSGRWRAIALQRRADQDVRCGRYGRAAEAIDETIAFFEQTDDVEQRIVSYCLRIDLAWHLESAEMMRATTDRARSFPAAVSGGMMGRVLQSAISAALAMHAFREVIALSGELLEVARAQGDAAFLASAHAGMAAGAEGLFDISLAREHYELAREHYARQSDLLGLARVAHNSGVLFLRTGLLERAHAELSQAERGFREIGHRRGVATAQLNLSALATASRDYAQAAAYARKALDFARSTNNAYLECSAMHYLGEAELGLGKVADAEEHLLAALSLAREANRAPILAMVLGHYTIALVRQGRFDAAKACVDEALDLYATHGETLTSAEWIFLQAGFVYYCCGERSRSREFLREAANRRAREAAKLPEGEMRRRYLELPWNKDIDAALRDEWPAWCSQCARSEMVSARS